jgi:hypothetical protein
VGNLERTSCTGELEENDTSKEGPAEALTKRPTLCEIPLLCSWLLLFTEQHQILPIPLFSQVLLRDESKCRGIHAVAKSRGRWPVVEDMAEMGIATLASDFSPGHEKTSVLLLDDV